MQTSVSNDELMVKLYAIEGILKEFWKYIEPAKTVIWNGPVGVFEIKKFSKGTRTLCEELKRTNATTIVGGGDSAAAVRLFGYEKDVTHVSTGGGASLELLEGKELPGITCITEK